MTPYDSVMKWFEYHKVAFYHRFAPLYISSIGAHMVNLANDKYEFYFEQGKLANTRIHIMFCAPPGFMKTLMLSSFLMGPTAILNNSDIQIAMEGSCTEAAFAGTMRMVDGIIQEVPGAAQVHTNSIVGVDEFSALSNAMKMEHSLNLDNAMLTALDSGYVFKRLALGEMKYKTNLTLWAGSQPLRFDLTSGLARRFVFAFFVPSKAQIEEIKKARRAGKNIKPNLGLIKEIHYQTKAVQDQLKMVKAVDFHPSVEHALDELQIPHYEESLFERIALGYTVMSKKFDRVINVKMDTRLREMFMDEKLWRIEIKKGAELSTALMICKDYVGATREEIKEAMADFGINWHKANEILIVLEKMKAIKWVKPRNAKGIAQKERLFVVT